MLYPLQNDIRNTLDISGFWDFQLDPDEVGHESGWANGLDAPRQIAVPGSWNEQFEDAYHYLGMAWYVRDDIFVPGAWQGEKVFIRVGSANYFARVWVNGVAIGEHEGGHLPFAFDITEQVTWGETNTIAIQVENYLKPSRVPAGNLGSTGMNMGPFGNSYPSTMFDFFPYAGLQRPVILYSEPQVSIEDVTVVTDIDGADGTVKVTVKQSGQTGTGHLALSSGEIADLTFVDRQAEATLNVSNARFWSPDDPYLYDLTITLTDGDSILDRYSLEVGIRTFEVKGSQLLLNGEPVYMKGFGRHEDFYVSGRGLNMPLIVKDYNLMKWLGANSYRTSHYPYSEEEMRMADREGMLIIDEIPAVTLIFMDGEEAVNARLEICKQQLADLIQRDKNHPSVIMWSVANEPVPPAMAARFMGAEVDESADELGKNFLKTLVDQAHETDPTRPAGFVSIMFSPNEWMDVSDVVMMNRYWGWYMQTGQLEEGKVKLAEELDTVYEALQKPIIMTEFGADTVAGMHSQPPKVFTEEYQTEFIRMYLDVADERDFVVGMHIWNFADFQAVQSTSRIGGMNLKGVFTRAREPKMVAHLLREYWT